MNSDNPCRHVRGVGCGRCLFLNHPAPVRITGQSTSNQCGNEDSDSNLYLPCDVNLEGETSSVVSEDMHDAVTPRWMLPRGLKRQRLDQPPSDSSTENRIHEKRCEIRKRKPYNQSKIHPWTEQTGGLWEEEHNSPPRDGAQTVGQQTPEAPTADQPLDKPEHHLAQRRDKPRRHIKRARSTAPTLPSFKKHRKSTDQLIAEAHSTHHSGEIWSPMVSHSTPVPPPTSSPPKRLPRAVKRLPSRLTIASIPGVSWIPNYPGKRPDQEVGRGPSTHLGAGMGIIALTPLTYGTHGTRWQDNIFCQYVGRVLPLSTAEREDYLSDYLLGWPQHGEAVDGQLDNQGSIGKANYWSFP